MYIDNNAVKTADAIMKDSLMWNALLYAVAKIKKHLYFKVPVTIYIPLNISAFVTTFFCK